MKRNNIEISFESFLKGSMTALEYDELYKTLGISKRMFTLILREPSKMEINQVKKISEITKRPLESIVEFIS
jgi:hypothetical protein